MTDTVLTEIREIPAERILDADFKEMVARACDSNAMLGKIFESWPTLEEAGVRLAHLIADLPHVEGRPVLHVLLDRAADAYLLEEGDELSKYRAFATSIVDNAHLMFSQAIWGHDGTEWRGIELITEPLQPWIRAKGITKLIVTPGGIEHTPMGHFSVWGERIQRDDLLKAAKAMLFSRLFSYRDTKLLGQYRQE